MPDHIFIIAVRMQTEEKNIISLTTLFNEHYGHQKYIAVAKTTYQLLLALVHCSQLASSSC